MKIASNLGVEFGSRIWESDLGVEFGSQIWGSDFEKCAR